MLVILVLSTIPFGGGLGLDLFIEDLMAYATHFIEYAVFGALLVRALLAAQTGAHAKSVVYAVAAATVYGGIMEVVQSFLPYRSFSMWDMVANLAGAVTGTIIARFIDRQRR